MRENEKLEYTMYQLVENILLNIYIFILSQYQLVNRILKKKNNYFKYIS